MKEINKIQIGKEEVQVFLFTDDMIVYIHDTKIFTRQLLELIHMLNNVAGHKINSHE